jgi:hypothetical protein
MATTKEKAKYIYRHGKTYKQIGRVLLVRVLDHFRTRDGTGPFEVSCYWRRSTRSV